MYIDKFPAKWVKHPDYLKNIINKALKYYEGPYYNPNEECKEGPPPTNQIPHESGPEESGIAFDLANAIIYYSGSGDADQIERMMHRQKIVRPRDGLVFDTVDTKFPAKWVNHPNYLENLYRNFAKHSDGPYYDPEVHDNNPEKLKEDYEKYERTIAPKIWGPQWEKRIK